LQGLEALEQELFSSEFFLFSFFSTNLQLLGQTTSTGAVGTYAGKIKVRINETNYYIPYYAS